MRLYVIWKQSCNLLSVLITAITRNSTDRLLYHVLTLCASARLAEHSGELLPDSGASVKSSVMFSSAVPGLDSERDTDLQHYLIVVGLYLL